MHIFYKEDIESNNELSEIESTHAVKVLRLTEGDEILVVDGKTMFYKCIITRAHHKRCAFDIIESYVDSNIPDFKVNIAVAPTKNIDRIEWFAEKATEIGVNSIVMLKCRYSERKDVKKERLEKIIVSAMKQSVKASLPQLESMIGFKEYVTRPIKGQKFIAHCYKDQERVELKDLYKKGEDATILIGPEGDFSEEEVKLAIENGFQPISLGKSRLRTETAALAACHTIHILN